MPVVAVTKELAARSVRAKNCILFVLGAKKIFDVTRLS
jgi:hypothetical protein